MIKDGFSRKVENHAAATALDYFAYNSIKIHRPSAVVSDGRWRYRSALGVSDLVDHWEGYERRRAKGA